MKHDPYILTKSTLLTYNPTYIQKYILTYISVRNKIHTIYQQMR